MLKFSTSRFGQSSSGRWTLLLNAVCIGFLGAIALYIKSAGLFDTAHHHVRVELLSRLFEESFLPSQPYLGLLASVSDILWCTAAVTCWLTYLLLRPLQHPLRAYLLFSAVLLSLFLLDDVFRLTLILALLAHIPKLVMYSLYGTATLTYALCFCKTLAQTPYPLLLVAVGLLVVSALADVVHLPGSGTPILMEDGTKLLGILNISLYFYQVCRDELWQAMRHSGSTLT